MFPSLSTPLPAAAAATLEHDTSTAFSAMHPDIIQAHILTRLDGPSLASASSTSTTLHTLSAQDNLWTNICHSTWPSTLFPRVHHIISTFPDGGPCSFFANSYPIPLSMSSSNSKHPLPHSPTSNLISAVDIHYQNKLIFTKVQETETVTQWFLWSPFRIDLLEPKDVVPTPIEHPANDDTYRALIDDMTLSWILIDPMGMQAVNLSSFKPVSVQRHWLSGEVQVRFASILAGDKKGSTWRRMQCEIVVTCGGSEGGDMQVREVSLEVGDMDGKYLNGKESLVILQRALEGKKGKGKNREEEARRRYREFLDMKRDKKERRLKTEGALDVLSVAIGGITFAAALWFFMLCN